MAELRLLVEKDPVGTEFAEAVVTCVVSLSEEGPTAGSLSVPFGLTAWMQRYGADLSDTIDTVFNLRTALLTAAGLDRGSEPVPLPVGDQVLFVLNLASYLEGLLDRAARALGGSIREAADAAVELLRSN